MVLKTKPATIGELKESHYRVKPIREEMRGNLIRSIRDNKEIFPGIIGYSETVIPQIVNAILSGQDMIFLGERGQAKSRIMRLLTLLLDEEIPVIKDCEINDSPFDPICRQCKDKISLEGDNVEINWIGREERYGEKLATPDVTISDLIGDVDPIKVAEGRYLSDELTIHYGLLPRTNRGIFAINELPDLAERLQVGLFNLMEERDIQIRGYRIRLPLDIFLVASANPEDYTNRGRIITPLKDRFGSQVRTHYPSSIEEEIQIMESERKRFDSDEIKTYIPQYMKEIIAEITHLARKSPDINQSSGVSVRVSIANYETLISNSIRRAISLHEKLAVPRITDLPHLQASTSGKIELESFEDNKDGKLIDELTSKAIQNIFERYFEISEMEGVVSPFHDGLVIETSEMLDSHSYSDSSRKINGLDRMLKKLGVIESPEASASAIEFILEGLYLNKRLTKTTFENKLVYRR